MLDLTAAGPVLEHFWPGLQNLGAGADFPGFAPLAKSVSGEPFSSWLGAHSVQNSPGGPFEGPRGGPGEGPGRQFRRDASRNSLVSTLPGCSFIEMPRAIR